MYVGVILIPVLIALLAGCTNVTYTASCNPGDAVCQRNQNAQTLAIIGQEDAAIQLLCEDDTLRSTLDEQCAGR
jgi:uncharacterized lipoprotein YajG